MSCNSASHHPGRFRLLDNKRLALGYDHLSSVTQPLLQSAFIFLVAGRLAPIS
jgi:hypothetical protein